MRMHSCLNGNEPSGNGTNEDPGIVFASLDLQPSWKLYVDTFGYEFAQWDMHKSGAMKVWLLCPDFTLLVSAFLPDLHKLCFSALDYLWICSPLLLCLYCQVRLQSWVRTCRRNL